MRYLISIAAPALLLGAGQLLAQQPAQTIPRELAVAFARGYAVPDTNAAVDFFPGAIAPAVADKVSVPSGARLIGTVAIARSTVVLAASIDAPDSILAWYARDYAKRGWSGFSLIRVLQAQSARGGFRTPPPARPSSFCSGGTVADISASRGLDGQTNIRVRLGPPTVAAACQEGVGNVRPGTPVSGPGSGAPSVPLPVLYDPASSAPMNQCFTMGSSQQSQPSYKRRSTRRRERLQTRLSPAQLGDLFAKQLADSGWVASAAPAAVHRVWTRPDSAGMEREMTLTITPSPVAGCHDVGMQVRRVVKR